MASKKSSRAIDTRDAWAAQIAAMNQTPAVPAPRKEPLTAARIVEAALGLVQTEGYDALTMRRVAAALESSPGALYVHVRDKAALDDLMIGELCSRIAIPTPRSERWLEQTVDVCRQLRDQYLSYPGIGRAALASTPHSLNTLRITEGLLAILTAGGVSMKSAAWASDAAYLYISAYTIVSLRRNAEVDTDGNVIDRDEVVERFEMLPAQHFPITVAHAKELTSGDGHERFDFTLELIFGGLTP